jgi:membrane protease YdiL (CAAX protease family)
MKKNGILVFIGLALGITWLLWIPALALVSAKGYPLPTIDYLLQKRSFTLVNGEHALAVTLFSSAVYGPLLAGLIVTWMEGGRKRAAEWFAPVLNWRVKPYWLGMALLIALAVALLPVLVGLVSGLATLRPGGVFPPLLLVLGLFVYQLLTSGLGEEPGWRAYLLPRLQAGFGREKAVWGAGLVWALWHFPFTIYYTLQGAPDLPPASQLALVIPALIGQTMSLIGMVYIYAWLVNGSQSVFTAVVFHALGNTLNSAAGALVVANPVVSLGIGAMPWLIVLFLERTGKKAQALTKSA